MTPSKEYRITLEGQTFQVRVLDDPRGERVRVNVNGHTLVVNVEAMQPDAPRTATPPSSGSSAPSPDSASAVIPGAAGTVTAPLPGTIKSIAVQLGQRVEPNDELLVIEAMKMDNVIRATRTGRIDALHVTEGRQVAHGEPILSYTE
ncbi:MAG TPA: biotin/lipoyl-binding protein [Chloroflexi bacterium]|nr:biotin/lipoyl-binding protein [Chloroflexota bacterium]